jgi:hypothetical protein
VEVRDADEFVNQLHPGVVYRQFPIRHSTVKEGVKYDKYSSQVVERVGLEERGIWEVDMLLQWATGGTFECVE